MHTPGQTYTATPRPGRFVTVFDTADARVLDEQVPGLLTTGGLTAETYFPRLGIAVVDAEDAQIDRFRRICSEAGAPLQVFPELTYHALAPGGDDDAVGAQPDYPDAESTPQQRPRYQPRPAHQQRPTDQEWPTSFEDTDELTWGVQAVAAVESGYTGSGVRVAVLDTGFDAEHPDFADREVTAESFIEGESADDAHGHGTHCIGTACGPREDAEGRGYGVAPAAEIFAGKVLGDDGSGSDASILAGIDWALQNECAVISMSLGADVEEVHPPYVTAGQRALEQGSLIIAAAGNNAARNEGETGFVGAPANSPYIMAIGAIDTQLDIADFSARTLPRRGGQVDAAGPGVDVYSAWAGEEQHNTISGTSMATPHVSGVAALLVEATGFRGRELWAEIVQEARRLEVASVDVGSGLATAPPPADERDPDQQDVDQQSVDRRGTGDCDG